jgi:transposase
MVDDVSSARLDQLQEKLRERESVIAEKDALIEALRALIASLEGRTASLESTLVGHAHEIALLQRKLFGPRSERTGTTELQLSLGDILGDVAALQKQLDALQQKAEPASETPPAEPPAKDKGDRPKPKGRRDLSLSSLPKVTVDLTDTVLEAQGAKRIDFEVSRLLGFRRGGFFVVVKRSAKYELPVKTGGTTVLGVEQPKTLLPRGMLHTSTLAWLAVEKFSLGVPHHRLEQHLEDEGVPLSRSVMSRNMEEIGSVLGATVVHAMFNHARTQCGVLSTDATGAAIQPGPRGDGPKRPCAKGHFFTVVADCDHVLFEFTSEHSSAVVARMFQGFTGYLQSDASSVYDILDRGPPTLDGEEHLKLVGCWAHCRRYFFEAAVCKYPVGLEGLKRIRAIYHAEHALSDLAPVQRQKRRQVVLAPLIQDFFDWVASSRRTEPGRTLATRALGYASNQEHELRRVLLDGRLPLDNTRSERALRNVVVGRKNWLFYGSELHAGAAAALFTLIASCRLHRLDPFSYLEELLRVLPYWPRERYLELSPLRWSQTRSRLDPKELDRPLGAFTVPPEAD